MKYGNLAVSLPGFTYFLMNMTRRMCSQFPSWLWLSVAGTALAPASAHASLLDGETLDKAADVLSWVVLIVVPLAGLIIFWLVHILPEKIAEKRNHPQASAIQCLCLLSLVFGGLFWPLAWLWAYSKPVLYRMAYGPDADEQSHGTTQLSNFNQVKERDI